MTVVILASGPSLTIEQVDHVRKRQESRPDKIATIAINNTYRRAPWATDLYACDAIWWREYKPTFAGRRWTQERAGRLSGGRLSDTERMIYKVNAIESRPGMFLDLDQNDRINTGGNSAFQAVNFAINRGAVRVVLVGVDLQATGGRSHWHGDHDANKGLSNPKEQAFVMFRQSFDNAAAQLEHTNIEFIQATADTALRSWPRMTIEEALKEPLNDWRSPSRTR